MRSCLAAVVLLVAGLVPVHAADLTAARKPPRREPPPKVVEYVPAPPPGACGATVVSPYGHSHCYGEYRPWRQPGCWWRHGVYVCPPLERLVEQGYLPAQAARPW